MTVKVNVMCSKDALSLALYNLGGKTFDEIEFYKKDGDYSIIQDATIDIYSEYLVITIENAPISITRLDGIVEWVLH